MILKVKILNFYLTTKNISFGGSKIDAKSTESLNQSAKLFGLEPSKLQLGLTSRMMQPTKAGVKGTLIMYV